MKLIRNTVSILLIGVVAAGAASAQHRGDIAENAALRYWAAFSEIRDSSVTDQEARELNAILDGTAPYDDSKYEELVRKNELALQIMSRGTSLRNCDWGLDYGLDSDAPVEYARKALVLGRLNVLYTFHLLKTGKVDGAVHALAAGVRFSHDVANDGSLFAALVAKSLLVDHLRAIVDVLRFEQVTASQRSELQIAVAGLGQGIDWSLAAKHDLESLGRNYVGSSQAAGALSQIIPIYVAALSDESKIPALQRASEGAQKDLVNVIPNIKGVTKAKQDLSDALRQTRASLQ